MIVDSVDAETGKLQMKADMNPIPCNSGIEYVGFIIDDTFDNSYNKSDYYIVPVIKQ
jgi:hypothetical protein